MRIHPKLKWTMAVCVIALAAGEAAAQPTSGSPSSPNPLPFQNSPNLSAEQAQAQADTIIQGMQNASTQVGKRQLKATADSDVVLALCLKDKLGQIDKAVASAKERRGSLSNPDIRSHAFTIIVVQKGNADRAVREAAQCIGKDSTTSGDTRVVTNVDMNLPPEGSDRPGGPGVGGQFPSIDNPPGVIVVSPPGAGDPTGPGGLGPSTPASPTR